MQRNSLYAALMLGLAITFPASAAMEISRTGQGQVLIFPYYTVNGGNSTLLSLVNHTDEVKALKIRFSEAMNGRDVLDFNVYLPPHGNWRAGLVADDEQGAARLVSSSGLCTAPEIPAAGVPFRNAAYSGSQDDAGPSTLARTREGMIEVIEMGVVVDDGEVAGPFLPLPDAAGNRIGVDNEPGDGDAHFATSATPDEGFSVADCQALVEAWVAGGAWAAKPWKDIDEPSGGVSGMATIVDVASGVSYDAPATAIEGFFTVADSGALHTPPGSLEPTLADAQTRAPATPEQGPTVPGLVETWLVDGNQLRWKVGRPDAVSALLMRETISNRFETADSMQAASEWVVTFPTKRLHLEHADAAARAPFTDAFGGAACEPIDLTARVESGHPVPVATPQQRLCFQCNVIAFNQWEESQAGQSAVLASHAVASYFDVSVGGPMFELESGQSQMLLGDEDNAMLSEAGGTDGVPTRLSGLPAIGFWVARFVNANAQPGVLASYALTAPHTGSVRSQVQQP